jgi:hypothetical protein
VDACHDHVRKVIPHIDRDVFLADLIEKAIALVRQKELAQTTSALAEKLGIDFKNETHELFGIY